MKLEKLSNVLAEQITGEWGQEGEDVAVLRTTNFTNEGRLNLNEVVRRSISKDKILKKRLKLGDTIIEKSGGSPTQPVGRVVYFDVNGQDYLCNNFTSILRPSKEVYPRYLFWFLFANHLNKRTLNYQNKTTGIINLKLERYLEETKIPLPPLPIQKKIAAILDKADSVRQKDKQLLEHHNKLAQSIFYHMFGDPVRNEKGWDKVTLGTLGEWKSGGTPSREKENRYFNGSIPWVSSGELNQVYISDTKEKITNEAIKESNAKLIQPGAILLGMYDTAGLKSSINTVPLACNQAIAYSHLNNKKTDTLFVYFQIQLAKDFLKGQQRGVRQKNFNLSMIKDIEIISPPLKAQEKFGNAFGRLLSNVQLISHQDQFSTQLFQTLLQKAFKGELVKEP